MPEISSPKNVNNVIKPDVKVDKTASNFAGVNKALANKEVAQAKEPAVKFDNADKFTSELAKKDVPKPSQPSQPAQSSQNISKPSSTYSKMANAFINFQERVDKNNQAIVDISDKLAAIYGEKEKDIKDKLSDSFKKLVLRHYNLLSEVDTSMGQKEHNKEKKLKDSVSENQNHKITLNKKEFSLSKWINYKLLEIAGEILNISRKFAAGIKKRHNSIKKYFCKKFKKVKEKIVFILDKIDALFESSK